MHGGWTVSHWESVSDAVMCLEYVLKRTPIILCVQLLTLLVCRQRKEHSVLDSIAVGFYRLYTGDERVVS